jgi:hypothetical protein
MSHITKINLIVKDLDAMDKAAKRLGLELVRNQKTFKGWTEGRCDHALRVVGAPVGTYEIGLKQRADGKGYDLQWDGHMGAHYVSAMPLYSKVGYGEAITFNQPASTSKLLDWYAAEVSQKQMRKQGFRVNAYQRDRKVEVLCSK